MEVGAGIGNHSVWLPVREQLLITEADTNLFPHLEKRISEQFQNSPKVKTKLLDLSKDWTEELQDQKIDTVVSFNVLEHVEDDKKAINSFIKLLSHSPGQRKTIVTFVPAHQWALGSVDVAYGHFRRYTHQDFFKVLEELNIKPKVYYRYFNLTGLFGWYVMGKIAKKTEIGLGPVKSFEKICPYLKGFDDFIHEKLRIPFGQSLLFVIEL